MSVAAVRSALESALNAMSPAVATAWEGVGFDPTPGSPYQRVTLHLAEPLNDEISPAANYVERGLLSVMLMYPLGTGPAAAEARAQLIRTTFYRGRSLTSGGITVTVIRTPEVHPALIDGDRFALPVSVRFWAPVNS